MNKNNVIEVAMLAFYRRSKASKIKRTVHNIVQHLERASIKNRSSMLDLIVMIMGRECFSKTTEVKDEFWERNVRLGDAIAELAFKAGDIQFISRHYFGLLKPQSPEKMDVFFASRFLATRFHAFVGSSLDRTLQFCRLAFSYLIRHEEARVRSNGIDVEDETVTKITEYIVMSMCSACGDEIPHKRWICNLISAADHGNEEAAGYFKTAVDQCIDVKNIIAQGRGLVGVDQGRQMKVIRQSEFDTICPDKVKQLFFDWRSLMRIIVPDHLFDAVVRMSNRAVMLSEQEKADASSFLKWFTDHATQISARFDEMGNTIISKPRYGVRPMGYDSFLVNVSALRCIGITSFSFYPEGEQLPNLKVEVAVKRTCYGLCRLWMRLQDLELLAIDEIFMNWQDFNITLLRSILEYIIVDALHRIVAEKPKKDLSDEEVERLEEPRDVTPSKRIKVRPFIRRLPQGFEASDEAQRLAFLQLGWTLLPGMTFVKTHDRWAGLPAGKPAPLFKYTDESVRKSIEQEL